MQRRNSFSGYQKSALDILFLLGVDALLKSFHSYFPINVLVFYKPENILVNVCYKMIRLIIYGRQHLYDYVSVKAYLLIFYYLILC